MEKPLQARDIIQRKNQCLDSQVMNKNKMTSQKITVLIYKKRLL